MNTEDLKECFQPVVAGYPHPQAALAPLLHALVELQHPLDNQTIAVAAELCEVDVRSVAEIVTHYAILQTGQPKHANVCFGLPCYLNGAKEVLEHIKAEYPPDDASTKEVTVSFCLGHCYAAPVLSLADGTVCRATLSTSKPQGGNK